MVATIIIAAVILVLFVLAIRRTRKKGGGCECGCDGCAAECPSKPGDQK